MWPWVVAGLTVGADQWTKWLLRSSYVPGESHPALGPFLSITYVQNTGAAFGVLKGQHGLFVVLSIGVIGWMAWELMTRSSLHAASLWGCALVLGGALGNLIDRLRFGYVVDFIDVRVWPVFNIGDSTITIGVSLLVLHTLLTARRQETGDGRQE